MGSGKAVTTQFWLCFPLCVLACLFGVWTRYSVTGAYAVPTTMALDLKALTTEYFQVWNAHDKAGIEKLHAPTSLLKDWDGQHGPTNADVSNGIDGIWKAVPNIKIEVLNVFTSVTNTCVANVKVIVGDDAGTVLNVVDVIEYDAAGLVVSLNAYKA